MRLLCVALLLCACGSSTDNAPADAGATSLDGGPVSGEPPELAGITAAHDAARAQLGETPLAWDPALAAIAAGWAAQCIDVNGDGLEDHDPNRSATYPTYVGENIYASTGTATGPDAVAAWVAEVASYDHDSNTCAAGAECGHYTQVVWAATQKLGCAVHRCASLRYSDTIVCDYGPGGNDGSKPY